MSDMQDKYKTVWTARFKKEYKLAVRRGQKIGKLDDIIRMLAKDLALCYSALKLEMRIFQENSQSRAFLISHRF